MDNDGTIVTDGWVDLGQFYFNTDTSKACIDIEHMKSNSSNIVTLDNSLTVRGDLLVNSTNIISSFTAKANQRSTYAKTENDAY